MRSLIRVPLLILLSVLLLNSPAAAQKATAVRLRVEYLERPLGLDVVKPRFSWLVTDSRRGAKQTGNQVQVASTAEKLQAGAAELWDSGTVASDESVHVDVKFVKIIGRWALQ